LAIRARTSSMCTRNVYRRCANAFGTCMWSARCSSCSSRAESQHRLIAAGGFGVRASFRPRRHDDRSWREGLHQRRGDGQSADNQHSRNRHERETLPSCPDRIHWIRRQLLQHLLVWLWI
jgi:hypothetical protein